MASQKLRLIPENKKTKDAQRKSNVEAINERTDHNEKDAAPPVNIKIEDPLVCLKEDALRRAVAMFSDHITQLSNVHGLSSKEEVRRHGFKSMAAMIKKISENGILDMRSPRRT